MNVRAHLHRLLLPVALIAELAYAFSGADPILPLLVIPVTVVGWWMTGPQPERAAPRIVVNLLLAVICLFSVWRFLSASLNVTVFADFVALLLTTKMLDRRRARDAAQVITLSIFLVIGAILSSNSIEVGLLMLLFIFVCGYTFMVFQIVAASEAAGEVSGTTPDTVMSGVGTRRGLRSLVGLSLAIGLPITITVFIVMPRQIGNDSFGAWGNASVGSVTGFNDEIQLGRSGLISDSAEPVLDLRVTDASGEVLGSVNRRFYLRGAVLDSYNAETGRWSGVERGRRGSSYTRGGVNSRGDFIGVNQWPNDWDIEQAITIRNAADSGSHLFALWKPKQIKYDGRFVYTREGTEMRIGERSGRVDYIVRSKVSDPAASLPENSIEITAEQRQEIEFDSEPLKQRASQLIAASGISPDPAQRSWADDAEAAGLLAASFSRSGQYTYTMEQTAPPSRAEPVEWFVLDSKEGHCEYFASGLAALCRSIGINARVITGFVAADFHESSGHYVVRASNAHAWVEVQVGPELWRTFDPTPSADLNRVHEPKKTLIANIQRFFESVEFAWISTVVGFDAGSRAVLLGGDGSEDDDHLLTTVERTIERATSRGPRVVFSAAIRGVIAFLVVVVLGMTLVGAGATLALAGWRGAIATILTLIGLRPRDA
ncbi:MAG: DUF3488 and transglutaminase-like domain-containing protein, partial [Planctomycetota bacterium]